jgi:general secretion pathway protein G
MKKNKKGFTFIEILVVITIIALLSTVAVVSYRSAQTKARDNKRKSDLEQVRAALEMYRSDEGIYPAGNWSAMTGLLTGYMNNIPTDPRGYSYYYTRPTETSYQICAYFENEGNGADCGDSCAAPANCNYSVTNP